MNHKGVSAMSSWSIMKFSLMHQQTEVLRFGSMLGSVVRIPPPPIAGDCVSFVCVKVGAHTNKIR